MYFLDPSGNPDLYKTKILNYFKQFEMIKGHELTYDTKSKILAKLIKSEFELKFNEWLHQKKQNFKSIITKFTVKDSKIKFVIDTYTNEIDKVETFIKGKLKGFELCSQAIEGNLLEFL